MKPRTNSTALLVIAIFLTATVGIAQSPVPKSPGLSQAPVTLAFEKLKTLEGTWEAPLKGKQEGKTMVDTFRVIGGGSAILAEEWLDGRQLTATVF